MDRYGRTPLHLAKSRLKGLSDNRTYSSSQLKEEVKQVKFFFFQNIIYATLEVLSVPQSFPFILETGALDVVSASESSLCEMQTC